MKRHKTHLVCQHLEKISRKALEEYQDVLKQFVRRRHGVYALYRKDKLCYVGLASNLRSRLNHHLRDRHANTWDRFSVYLTLKSDHLRELEALAIRIASPKGNRQKGKLGTSQDLKRIFRRTVADKFKQELNELFESSNDVGVDEQSLAEIMKGRKPILAGYFKGGRRLRMHYKGKIYRAYVKKNGTIRFKKKIYTSPSMAASAVTKKPMDGWYWWRYERAPGDWTLINELRK